MREPCIHDTNRDGDCHLCHRTGGCPTAPAQAAGDAVGAQVEGQVLSTVQKQLNQGTAANEDYFI